MVKPVLVYIISDTEKSRKICLFGEIRAGSPHLKKSGHHVFASAYGITANAAEKLVALQTPIIFPADHVLPYAITNNILKGFATVPKVFLQQSQVRKEVVGSYMIVSAENYDDAVEVVRACPAVHAPGASLEIREMAGAKM